MNSKTFSQARRWCMGSVFVTMFWASAIEAVEEPDYFPLQMGNTWTYLRFLGHSPASPPETLTVAIVDTQRINDNLYYRFSESEILYFIPSGKLIRKDAQRDVIEYNPITQRECLWFRVIGETFEQWTDCEGRNWVIGPEEVAEAFPYSNLFVKGRSARIITWGFGFGMQFIDGLGILTYGEELGDSYVIYDAVINGEPFPRSPDTLIRENGWGVIKARFLPLSK